LAGALPYTPTVGDVDGDGQLDIVVISVSDIEDPTSFDSSADISPIHNETNKGNLKSNSKKIIHSQSLIYVVNAATGKVLDG
jgi:FG-GAP repeat